MQKYTVVISFVLLIAYSAFGQKTEYLPIKTTVCPASYEPSTGRVLAPEFFRLMEESQGHLRTTETTVINVNYVGFSDEARGAFQRAVDIWSVLLNSSVPINMQARYEDLGNANVLGSAGSGRSRAFPGAIDDFTWYPTPIAERIAGVNLNGNNIDISARFNVRNDWYFGTDADPPDNQFDFTTVVLHEIGHGLGFSCAFHGFNTSNRQGTIRDVFDRPGNTLTDIFGQLIQDASSNLLFDSLIFDDPSTEIGTRLTGGNLFFKSERVAAVNDGNPAQLWAPGSYAPGSSVSHLDENVYPSGSINTLMTPSARPGEVSHDPGPITLHMLAEMGWVNVWIDHENISFNESNVSNLDITAKITGDSTLVPSSIRVFYSDDKFVSDTNSVQMTATANPDEYTASIPAPSSENDTVDYYISVGDNSPKTYTLPGRAPQAFYSAFIGRDTEPPQITHDPITFLLEINQSNVPINATVSDNYRVKDVLVEYNINGNAQTPIELTFDVVNNIYESNFNFARTLLANDTITYRIVASDVSIGQNQAFSPNTSFYQFVVEGVSDPENSYQNDFNTPSDDFAGNGFSITTPTGFANDAIHSQHPYPNGSGPNDESNYIYYLTVPVILSKKNALMFFDEIVLVEPGQDGSTFGDQAFFDFVVVEGSADHGTTWVPFVDGYDSRTEDEWDNLYRSVINDNVSEAVGMPDLFKQRRIDMTTSDAFEGGDTVIIRFRLFVDQLANGWGWAIDNLEIQSFVEEEPPFIAHTPIGFSYINDAASIVLTAAVTDNIALDTVYVEYAVNGTQQPAFAPTQGDGDLFEGTFAFENPLNIGDTVTYRIVATDIAATPNQATSPTSGFYRFVVVSPRSAVTSYANNFNTASSDFVGNGFSITTPTGFNNPAIHSSHPYVNNENAIYTLLTPIVVSAVNDNLQFDEIVLVEPGTETDPSDAGFKDFVVVEISRDKGQTWEKSQKEYDAREQADWLNTYNSVLSADGVNSLAEATDDLYINRQLGLRSSIISPGNEVLVRFRLSPDKQGYGWGWAIDNLQINIVTGIEKFLNTATDFKIYPNPSVGSVQLILSLKQVADDIKLTVLNVYGQQVFIKEYQKANNLNESLVFETLPQGLYYVKLNINGYPITKKLLIVR